VLLRVNGDPRESFIEPRRSLIDALRCDHGLTGAKKSCDMGNCGACTVLLDGEAVYACLVLAVECEDRDITTIELIGDATLARLQQAFVEHDALQCGYCTPGQLMSLKALFDRDPAPTDAAIGEAVAGNLCRCGAYRHILAAARAVASMHGSRDGRPRGEDGSPREGSTRTGAPGDVREPGAGEA
jgi:aerobic-type carbon monoxide dehydrogenase small subunit (CoxS/CutS family)